MARHAVAVRLLLLCILLAGVSGLSPRAAAAPLPKLYIKLSTGPGLIVDAYNNPRQPGQLGIYDSDFGPSTMSLGPVAEFQVVKGIVQDMSLSGDMPIPAGGCVVSGDGKSMDWIKANVVPGLGVSVTPAPGWIRDYESKVWIEGIDAVPTGPGLYVFTSKAAHQARTPKQMGNTWEALVSGDTVTSSGPVGARIPQGGMAVAAYGSDSSASWIKTNLEVGSKVSLNGDLLTVRGDPARYVYMAQQALAASATGIQPGIEPIRQGLTVRIAEAASDLMAKSFDEGVSKALMAMATLDWLKAVSGSSAQVEIRGVWHRPTETDRDQVSRAVRTLAKANVNTVFLETFYWGKTIHPSSLVPQNEAFKGWDPLAAWIEEAHKAGIGVHAWLHTLRVMEDSPLLAAHPEWAQVSRTPGTDPIGTPAKHGGVDFLDPVNPGVIGLVMGLVDEISDSYALDGIHLDYIRFASSDPLPKGYSYGPASKDAFRGEWGVDPEGIGKANTLLYKEWNRWREDRVTDLLRGIRDRLLRRHPDMALSAAVVGDLTLAGPSKLQDWPEWVKSGLLDFSVPMLYHTEASWVGASAKKANSLPGAGIRTLVAGGLGPFVGLDALRLGNQIKATRDAGAAGSSMFALHSLTGGQLGFLQAGPFKEKAYPPYRPQGLRAGLDALVRRYDSMGMKGIPSIEALRGWLSEDHPGIDSAIESLTVLANAGNMSDPETGRLMDVAVQSALANKRWERVRALAPPTP